MPRIIENPNIPQRGFYGRRIPAKQLRQLEQESADLTAELNVLSIKARELLDQLEGIRFYTDFDMARLSMLNTLVNSIIRIKIKNRILTHRDLSLEQLIAAELDKDDGDWGQA